jgi:hypothetical protein
MPASLAIMAADWVKQKDINVVGEFVTGGDAPSVVAPPWRPPPPDWQQEELERLERERASKPEPGLLEEEPRPFPPPAREAAS